MDIDQRNASLRSDVLETYYRLGKLDEIASKVDELKKAVDITNRDQLNADIKDEIIILNSWINALNANSNWLSTVVIHFSYNTVDIIEIDPDLSEEEADTELVSQLDNISYWVFINKIRTEECQEWNIITIKYY